MSHTSYLYMCFPFTAEVQDVGAENLERNMLSQFWAWQAIASNSFQICQNYYNVTDNHNIVCVHVCVCLFVCVLLGVYGPSAIFQ